ncbi:MAG: phosphoenolpyruvate--protein phosphotransferase [Bacillota bacterium]
MSSRRGTPTGSICSNSAVTGEIRLQGIPAAPGVVVGRIRILCKARMSEAVQPRRPAYGNLPRVNDNREAHGTGEGVNSALATLSDAVEATRTDIKQTMERLAQRTTTGEEAEILATHLLVLDDPEFIGHIKHEIRDNKRDPHEAVVIAAEAIARELEALEDEYLKARAQDIRDVAERVLSHLDIGPGAPCQDAATCLDFGPGTVVVAEDLGPYDIMRFPPENVIGFVTEKGSATSHSAILARGLGFPSVVGAVGITAVATGLEGKSILLDGDTGVVLLNPSPVSLESYGPRIEESAKRRSQGSLHLQSRERRVVTADGVTIEIAANVGSMQDAKLAAQVGANGIGLLRTELLFVGRDSEPTEDEQYEALANIVSIMPERRTVIRTLDAGGDKKIPYIDLSPEGNPFLGTRGIRLTLAHPAIFKRQLRAILRAACHGRVAVMFPMVATVEEVRQAKSLVREAREELRRAGFKVPDIEVGIMIEVPCAALIADILAREVDFFSIGTNDLVQYVLAVDRLNPRVSPMYQPLHPALVRLIQRTVEAAHEAGIWVGMCGEMAGDISATELLVGLGLDELSVAVSSIENIREVISKISSGSARELARRCLQCSSETEVRALLSRGGPCSSFP